ncbi:flagellar basal-body MS-ring/collar protein FliF [Clostridium sp. C2-6-12]|uniref:flagellar basal-body MS-ring/collar protein FliF n=1 Tax=Clostridium sp. C2-6-12 TaxID=2698832 RepID=UPI00136F1B70|nr:flagellar basal-body MS-ring/collar protein FliF [Clostridium sp. C2-6-12]
MKKLLEKVKGLLEKFKSQNMKIKIAVIAAILAIIIAIISGIYYSSSNKYQILFSDLDPTDSQTVVTTLQEGKNEYKIEGNAILVPKDKVDELRLKLAPNLTSGSKGYELMDVGSSFGMTDEEFKIKKLRMQQGELEKTIKKFQQIEEARVHISEAKDSVFVKDSEPGKAVVSLTLKKGEKLSGDQVKAIVALVSGSANNIPRANVDVLDQNANLLTKDINNEQNGQASSEEIAKQQEAEKSAENNLKKKITDLLEPTIGAKKVKVAVNVNLDFDAKQNTKTSVDPNKVIISQENNKESNTSGTDGTTSQSPVDNNMTNTITNTNGEKSTSSKENQKTNYEVGKSESKTISAQGAIKRITAAVTIDGVLDDAQRQQIETLVGNAIGYDALRGDKVSVVGMPFDKTVEEAAKAAETAKTVEEAAASNLRMMIVAGILGAVLLGLIIFLIIKRRKKKIVEEEQLLNTLIDDSIIPKEPEEFTPIEFESKSQKSHLENEIKKYAMEKPEQVVEIIKSWLTEGER